jgi:hypothetical protein
MQGTGTENEQAQKQQTDRLEVILEFLLVPVLFVGALLAIPYSVVLRWVRQHREHRFRLRMKSRGRMIPWAEFLLAMHTDGGTCIEEKFSPKGPVRFWWTPENLQRESPHEIIDWFTMRKGRRYEPFVHWCRERYTGAEKGSAVLVETWGVPKKQIYALWSECRSNAAKARWVEVAPPEILPRRPGQ